MFRKIKFSELQGFSKSFIKNVNDFESVDKQILFPAKQRNIDSIINEAKDFQILPEFKDLIEKTNRKLKLSPSQRENIRLLNIENTFFCTATIKPAFLGGPTNIFLKVISVFIYCETLKSIYKQYNFIPLIWIDDDVHDNFESSIAHLFTKNGDIESVSCGNDLIKTDRTTIHKRYFDSGISKLINDITASLDLTVQTDKIEKILKKSYRQDFNWSFSFLTFFNSFLRNLGLLFICSSEVRKAGLFNNLTAKELSSRGTVLEIIKSKQIKLKIKGTEIADKASLYNLNFHKDNNVEKCVKRESFRLTDYSPNVMIKSIFYDSLLPVIYRISSPSELVFSNLLPDAYNYFQVLQPAFVPRYSITFVNSDSDKFLKENGSHLLEIISGYKRLEKMLIINSDIRKTVNWMYPKQNLQERILSLLNLVNVSKVQFVSSTVKQMKNQEPTSHFILDL
ncbi:MAG: bacillithiol biosynthesis BshC [bacterium]